MEGRNMESYLMITQINDFLFCPRSVYYGGIYRNSVDSEVYHQAPQIRGTAAHKTIDAGTYSSAGNILCALPVYSERYNLMGCIDVLDTESHTLTERKYSVTAVYDGFRFQLYAQYFALSEMGYCVKRMRLHSVKDNRNYEIPLPDEVGIKSFEQTLQAIRSFDLFQPYTANPAKCRSCIYAQICDMNN